MIKPNSGTNGGEKQRDPRGGHNKKSDAEHHAAGTWRADRQGDPADRKPKVSAVSTGRIATRDRERDVNPPPKDAPEWTRMWSRNISDERAAADGCWFDVYRACFTVWWTERYCRLYEGAWAGEPLLLRGAHSQFPHEPIMDMWDDSVLAHMIQRARDYNDAFQAGEPCDWQYECVMRTFGWVRWSSSSILKVHGHVRRFKRASYWVAKKNKKSPTMAALGLHLLCGDGEQGAKVFVGAKSAQQVIKNVISHMIHMVDKSEDLTGELKINRAHNTIEQICTSSYIYPLSGNDEAAHQKAEGAGGSLLIDETHVVDRAFMDRIDRMHISREEPLILQFSTAGSNPDGYGMGESKYARSILNGTITDHSYMAAVYEAPQDLTDAELVSEPQRYAEMANPALGHTVDLDELLSDYKRSSIDVRKLAKCKMYRLNIWQTSDSPWKVAPYWAACEQARKIEDFRGQSSWAGGDFSRARDMSALVFTFAEDARDGPHYYQFPLMWMVREYADAHRDKAAFHQWEQDGILTFCDKTIKYKVIDEKLREIHALYPIQVIRYDPALVTKFMEDLEEETGIPCVAFPQTILAYTGPTDDFAAAVREGTLYHDGNPCYAWQIQNAVVSKPDNNNNQRIVKPTDDDYRKVDAVQAGIMSLSAAMIRDDNVSIYATMKPFSMSGDE